MAVIYTDDEQRLVRAARDLASTLSEEIQVESLEDQLRSAIELNHFYAETIAKRNLRHFIEKRTGTCQ